MSSRRCSAAVVHFLARDGCTRGGSPGSFYCGGHGASPSPSFSCRAESSSRPSSEALINVDAGVWIANRFKPPGHRCHREVSRVARVDLSPGERSGHTRVRFRAHGICGGDRAILRVLVVVDEDAVPLFFPPLAGRQRGRTTFDLARQRERRAAHREMSSAARCAR